MEKKKNPHAQALGKLNRGKPKTLTEEQKRAKAETLAKYRDRRWKVKTKKKA